MAEYSAKSYTYAPPKQVPPEFCPGCGCRVWENTACSRSFHFWPELAYLFAVCAREAVNG